MGSDSRAKAQVEPPVPVAARSFSGRLIALVAVLIAVAVLLAPSVNNYLHQRADIASLKADIAAQQQQQKDLQTEISRWNDPAYVKQQARDRVNMMMPGETGYWVYGGGSTPAAPQQAGTSVNPESLPWVDGLWQSIVRSATE
ncbi:septum formation initiator family protein [Psychromicrobium silvestre]|uniref:FtsB family cell division protein n=1 Tax=Psychromicrobium silvestre TaxID=1645614 RepID=UPI0031B57F41